MVMLRRWIKRLFQPSARWSIAAIAGLGLVMGVLMSVSFELGLSATSTESFCISCHEMRENPYRTLTKTSHFNNRIGVLADCSDCHVPKEFVPKMVRKIEAAREVWGHLLGVIDTPEKYAAHLPVMKAREIARLQANDSQECRNCHRVDRMLTSLQTAKAQTFHLAMKKNGKTCIDCHAGIAHGPLPAITSLGAP